MLGNFKDHFHKIKIGFNLEAKIRFITEYVGPKNLGPGLYVNPLIIGLLTQLKLHRPVIWPTMYCGYM